jgi:acyl-CoA hydrolase
MTTAANDPLAPPDVTRMTEMVMPEHTNHLGTLFGGEAMRMMDVAAFVAATRHCRMSTVTRSIDQIDFHAPVSHGEIAELTARVIATGRTSMTVEVVMVAEALLSGERRLCGSGRFIFVALDEDGNPAPVPPLREG